MKILVCLLIGIIIPTGFGYSLLINLFRRRPGTLLSLALAYGLGLGLLVQGMLILGACKVPLNFFSIGVPIILLSAVLLLRARRTGPALEEKILNRRVKDPLPETSRPKLEKALWAALRLGLILFCTLQFCYAFWHACQLPIYSWDAIYFIAKKAKVFYFEQSLQQLKNFPWAFYPFFVTLAETWTAFSLGMWSDQWIKIIFPVAAASYAVVHFLFLKDRTNGFWALTGLTLLLSSNLFIVHASISYSDMFLLYYNCAAILLLLLWDKEKERGYLITAALFSGLGTFVKLEALGYFLIHSVLLGILIFKRKEASWQERLKPFLIFTGLGLSLYAVYFLYKQVYAIPSIGRLYYDFAPQNLARIPGILMAFGRNIFTSGNWNIVWFLLLASFVNIHRIRQEKAVLILSAALVLFFGFYFLLACFTSNYQFLSGELAYISLSRVILHFFPLAPVLIVLLNYPDKSESI